MAAPNYRVTAYWDLSSTGGTTLFTLDDPVKGVLDGAYVLGGDLAIDISDKVLSITVNRGVSRQFDQVRSGTCTIVLNNSDRRFDQLYAAGPYFGNIVPGKRMDVAIADEVIFAGEVESYAYSYQRNRLPEVTVTLVDALATLATKKLVGYSPAASQLPGARLNAVLDRPEVSFGVARDIDAGVFSLQADTVADNTNALAYAQLVTRSDLGRLFASRHNVLTFRDRHANPNAPADVLFINDGTGIKFAEVQRASALDYVWNYVAAARRGGSTEVFENLDSQTEFGIRSPGSDYGFTDLIVETDAQAYELGLFLATSYALPEDRFESFQCRMHGLSSALQSTIATLDMGRLVRGVFTPGGVGDPVDRLCSVEGLQHQIQRNSHVVTVTVGDVINRSVFVLDDPVYGVLDTGPGVLAF